MAPLVTVTGPDHIVLRVADPVVSCAWYSDTFGLAPVRLEEYKQGSVPFPSARVNAGFLIDFFKQEGAEAGMPDAGSDARRNTGFDHFCLVVDADDIEAVRQRLAGAGIEAEPQFDGVVVRRFGAQGTASSIYVRDPDHYVVELRTYAGQQQQPDAPATAEKPLTESKCAEGSGI